MHLPLHPGDPLALRPPEPEKNRSFPSARMPFSLHPLQHLPLDPLLQQDRGSLDVDAHAVVAASNAVRHAACSAFFRVAPAPYARCVPEASQTATRISPFFVSLESIT